MEDKIQISSFALIILLSFSSAVSGAAPDVDERFLEVHKQGKWLIEFYAPWCGHCKKLEPIYNKVHDVLRNSDVRVAKIDATRYSHVSSQFEVRGFPTIKFFNGDRVYTFRGERTQDDIMSFVNKARGPPVRWLSSIGKFNEAKSEHSHGVFFMFVGDDDVSNDLYSKYTSIANDQVSLAYFFAGNKKILPETVSLKSYPAVLVFKDGNVYEYESPRGVATMNSLQRWLNGERFTAFPKVSGGNINEMADTGKFLVIFVIDENDPDTKTENSKVKQIGEYMAKNERDKYHSNFQFLWMDDPDTVNNIMLAFISMPYVLVLDPTVHLYYIPDTPIQDLDSTSFGKFLEDVKNEKVKALGGTGFLQRVKRLFYDIFVTVIEVWESSRWLFLIMFGIPTAVISIVCYSLCCMDTVDEDVNSDDEDSDDEYQQIVREQQRVKDTEVKQDKSEKHEKAE